MMFFEMVNCSKLALWVQTYNLFSAKPVNSEEEARMVGEYIAHKLYDGTDFVDFSRYEEKPQVSEGDEIYSVWYRPNPRKYVTIVDGEFKEEIGYPDGGGGPCIKIEKSTGKILSWKLQK